MENKDLRKDFLKTHLPFILVTMVILILFLFISATTYTQTNWTRYQADPVLDMGPAGSWDSYSILGCSVVYDGTIYHMWYGGSDGINYRIGHATSQDGINWIKDTLNPVLDIGPLGSFDQVNAYVPSVAYIPVIATNGGTFHMWYDGYDGLIEQVGYATSPDGTTWTKDPLNPVVKVGSPGSWDAIEVFPMSGSVIVDGNTYKMWYGGLGIMGRYRIGFATSPDGSVWTKDTINNPVLTESVAGEWDGWSVVPGTVMYDGETYNIWYSGCEDDYRWRVGYATSPDGINWIRDIQNNPVLDYGPPGSWDYEQAWGASVLVDNVEGLYKMWYTGGPFNDGRVGYATDVSVGYDDSDLQSPNSDLGITNYPNPFSSSTTIEYRIEQPVNAVIQICNQYGQVVGKIIHNGHRGLNKLPWNAGSLPAGVYMCRVTAGNKTSTAKMLVVR